MYTFEDMRKRNDIPTVTELTWHIKDLLEGEFSGITVSGEVSQPSRSANGHVYFTLKDAQAQIACVMWRSTAERLKLQLEQGQQVNVSGDVQLYAPHGRYQIIVKSVEQAGEGALQQAFERLKAKLESEGLFDPARKRDIPRFPQTIGIVTSENGAAFQDMRSTLEKRYPLAKVLLYHAAVQGVGAAAEIARGIGWFSQSKSADVLIIGRGGGSLEDLWPFNEEVVARAIASCAIPVISAVGHETDFSISDFVADVRAATPTQAAVLVAPDVQDLRMMVEDAARRCDRNARSVVSAGRETIRRMLKTHALLAIRDKMQLSRQNVAQSKQRMAHQLNLRLNRAKDAISAPSRTMRPSLQIRLMRGKEKVEALRTTLKPSVLAKKQVSVDQWQSLHYKLQALNPTEPLQRGFTRVIQNGKWVRSAKKLDQKETYSIEWNDGKIDSIR
jgi:exodeoxyribonuclease VII large subunit